MTPGLDPNVQQALERFLRERFLKGRNLPLDPDASLVEQRLVPSAGWLEVLLFLEETFHFRVENHELSEENFGSLRALHDYVLRKRAAAGTAGA